MQYLKIIFALVPPGYPSRKVRNLGSQTSSVTVPHVGGDDALGHLSGIYGAHSAKIECVSTDNTDQNIPWVRKTNPDGSTTNFLASGASVPDVAHPRVMDCIGRHSRAADSFDTAEVALDKMMAQLNLIAIRR